MPADKPESEWIWTQVEAIVPEDLWKQCNDMLEARKNGKQPPGPKPVQLFGGLMYCGCGNKMYVFQRSPKYVCNKCHTKIPVVDMEAIFKAELEDFFISKEKVQAHLSNANTHLVEKKAHLAAHMRQADKVKAEMRKTYDLYQSDQISREGFGKLYKPLEEQESALSAETAKLQGEIDALEIHQLSADEIVSEATTLHRLWSKFTPDEKRRIVESITEKITVSGDEIDITFWNPPSSEELTKRQRTL
jgi:site-specific DNA recombinase